MCKYVETRSQRSLNSPKLGSANSHNCRSDMCVIAPKASVYERPLLPGEQVEKDALDKFAAILGFKEAVYLADIPAGRVFPGGQQ